MLNAIFLPGQTDITVNGLYQWDYGQQLQIEATDLPVMIEVHFACVGMKDAIVRPSKAPSGKATVAIPDVCLEQSAPITAWIFEIIGTTGTTTKTITLPIISRARPTISEEVPEEVGDKYTEAVAEINALVGALAEGDVIVTKAIEAISAETAGYATEALRAEEASRASEAVRANEATKAGTADEADNAKKVNNLEIKRDSNGILKIGERVIPQRFMRYATPSIVGFDKRELYRSSVNISGRTFEFVDTRGTIHKIIIDPTNRVSEQVSWMGNIYDPITDTLVYLEVDHTIPQVMYAYIEYGEDFTIEKIYEIIE